METNLVQERSLGKRTHLKCEADVIISDDTSPLDYAFRNDQSTDNIR